MPELPDLEVVCRFLQPRLRGLAVTSFQTLRPLTVRNLMEGAPPDLLVSHRFQSPQRRGKFLLLPLDTGTIVVINPMRSGRLRYGKPLTRVRKRDALILGLENGCELRYHDAADMGKVYLSSDLERVPGLSGLGPDAMDSAMTEDVFRERLKRYRGEIKGILTNQSFVAGIGNAYSDEICWAARVYPFRRRPSLTHEEVGRVYTATKSVLTEAIAVLEQRVGEQIGIEIRDFLAVHGKAGLPCPRCGNSISQVRRQRRATHFCRTCQPGLMVAGRDRRL